MCNMTMPDTNRCPRCGGQLELCRDHYGTYQTCWQCGNEIQAQDPGTLPLTDQVRRERPHRPPMQHGRLL